MGIIIRGIFHWLTFFLAQFFSDQLKKLEVNTYFIERTYSKSLCCNYFVAASRLKAKPNLWQIQYTSYFSYNNFKLLWTGSAKIDEVEFFWKKCKQVRKGRKEKTMPQYHSCLPPIKRILITEQVLWVILLLTTDPSVPVSDILLIRESRSKSIASKNAAKMLCFWT